MAPVHAGWYAVHATAGGAFAGSGTCWLHISPAPLRICIADAAMAVGGALPAFTWEATGLVGSDGAAMVVSGSPSCTADGSAAGRFAIDRGSLAAKTGDYALVEVIAGVLMVAASDGAATSSAADGGGGCGAGTALAALGLLGALRLRGGGRRAA
jgi:hypothetical protein